MGHIEPVSGQDTLSRRQFIITGVFRGRRVLRSALAFPGLASCASAQCCSLEQ